MFRCYEFINKEIQIDLHHWNSKMQIVCKRKWFWKELNVPQGVAISVDEKGHFGSLQLHPGDYFAQIRGYRHLPLSIIDCQR